MLLDRKGVVAMIDADEESVTDGCSDVLTRNNRDIKSGKLGRAECVC